MLYLGIDLHRKQMTVSLRNEGGDVLLRRQVEFAMAEIGGVFGSSCEDWRSRRRSMWRSSKSAAFTTGW